MKKYSAGFSLVEIMVVIVIIGIISSFTYVSFSKSSAKGRDTERRADLRMLQSAIELYKNKKGVYPSGCNASSTWSGQTGTSYECSSGNKYIVNLAPEFIPALPTDPKLNGADSGYVYTVNNEGTVYKLMALNTVESELVALTHEFVRCGNVDIGANECASVPTVHTGAGIYNEGFPPPTQCNTPATYNNDYAVWGGYATGFGGKVTERAREYGSDIIRCK